MSDALLALAATWSDGTILNPPRNARRLSNMHANDSSREAAATTLDRDDAHTANNIKP